MHQITMNRSETRTQSERSDPLDRRGARHDYKQQEWAYESPTRGCNEEDYFLMNWRYADPPTSSAPFQKWSYWVFGSKRCAMFWNGFKNNSQPTGYWVSLVSVSELGLQKFFESRKLKTKILLNEKNTRNRIFLHTFQYIAHLLG